jgi:hypothetical protein
MPTLTCSYVILNEVNCSQVSNISSILKRSKIASGSVNVISMRV